MRFGLGVVPAALILAGLTGRPALAEEVKLHLTPEMVINESGMGDAKLLVDEQDAVGDPLAEPKVRPERPYFAGWQSWRYPAHLIVDCGEGQKATSLAVFNDTGKNAISIYGGIPTRWTIPQELTLDGYRQWHKFTFDSPTRYFRITMSAPTKLPEIVAYGVREAVPSVAVAAAPKPRPRERPAFDQFLGVNAFIDDPIDKLLPVSGTVREYHKVLWDFENPDHLLRFQPSGAAGGNLWFFDDFYAKLAQGNVTVAPCLQQSLPWVTGSENLNAKPAKQGSHPAGPAAYADHAAHLFQYAARYGSRAVPDDELTLAPGQPRVSGLGLIRYFENANEPDKDWEGREAFTTPFEFAAQCSADYDGNRGALGPGHGIKAADPAAKLVMGGLYHEPLVYLDAMRFWAEHRRGGSLPFDVINVHDYCGDGDAQQAFKTKGVSPEDGKLRERAAEIVAWRDRYATPETEVWVTEFGYDTNPGSPLHAPALGTLSAEVVQGAWLVRSNLMLAAAGVDRAAMFMFRDVNSNGAGVFETCGLVTQKGSWTPKPSWYFQATLKKHLAGMRWASDVHSGHEKVAVMRFSGDARTAYVVWCPTSEDHRESSYRLPIQGTHALAVELAPDRPEGLSRTLEIVEGAVSIPVSEVPTIIVVD
jgi:hypothetical protein